MKSNQELGNQLHSDIAARKKSIGELFTVSEHRAPAPLRLLVGGDQIDTNGGAFFRKLLSGDAGIDWCLARVLSQKPIDFPDLVLLLLSAFKLLLLLAIYFIYISDQNVCKNLFGLLQPTCSFHLM